ncbi:MAG: protein kinase [Myxococcota bacterium]|jgi:serine/threonine-protein kinase|nr:protein kinase [Myxococcota bacterium]
MDADETQKHKIIHRDIKPSNPFVTTDRVVKIMDFGLAKMVEEVRRSTTIIGGTPNYMAPEQAVGEATDHRADLYALGGTLFHLLSMAKAPEDRFQSAREVAVALQAYLKASA